MNRTYGVKICIRFSRVHLKTNDELEALQPREFRAIASCLCRCKISHRLSASREHTTLPYVGVFFPRAALPKLPTSLRTLLKRLLVRR